MWNNKWRVLHFYVGIEYLPIKKHWSTFMHLKVCIIDAYNYMPVK